MNYELIEPWKIDSNEKYSGVVKTVMGLSIASSFLPILIARELLGIDNSYPLINVFTSSIYISWVFLGLSVLMGVFFQYLSAKWVRTAWGKDAGIFLSKKTKVSRIELWMEISFWICVSLFMFGIFLNIYFFSSFSIKT